MTTAPSTSTEEAPKPPAPAPAKSAWAGLRPLVLRLHFYAGVLVAPFLLVLAAAGLVLVRRARARDASDPVRRVSE